MRRRFLLALLVGNLVVVLPVLTAGYLLARNFLVEQAFGKLSLTANSVSINLTDWIAAGVSEARYLLGSQDLQRALAESDPTPWLDALVEARPWLQAASVLTRPGGRVAASSEPSWRGRFLNLSDLYVRGSKEFYVSRVYSFPLGLIPTLTISAPVAGSVLLLNVKLDRLETYTRVADTLGKRARVYLVNGTGDPVTSHDIGSAAAPRGLTSRAVDGVADHTNGSAAYRDWNGVAQLGAWRWIPEAGLGLIVELDEAEALGPSTVLGLLFLGLALATILLALLLALGLSASLSRPLEALSQVAEAVRQAKRPPSWPRITPDEVGTLNHALREMTRELARHSEGLEASVVARTADLRRTIGELESTRNQLVEAGKLALLGSLVAGISHELNTPLAAIQSSARFIQEVSGSSWSSTLTLFRGLPDDEARWFLALVEGRRARIGQLVGSQRRERLRALKAALVGTSAAENELLADQLADLGVSEVSPELANLLVREGFAGVLDAVWRLSSVDRSVGIIREASERAAKVIQALRIYARQDQGTAPEPTDLRHELDILLEIYYASLRTNIEIVRDYGDVPTVVCFRDRLNQVWANLINNAVHALGRQGKLVIAVHSWAGGVRVQVSDNGPGIPVELQHRVFTPFFTTKPSGEGTGLGLSISKSLVEEQGGTLAFRSRPGETVFEAWLPLAPVVHGST